ncbi:uncharacterized protein B0T23DRAFT_442296 [Neurospora hispaniola]|uniref:Uncharacterized protein n=1 Tax=Neurospora hispaniola TaxID=588809 RepID=A0AAJ0I851_9PEZI|nr:hypothetical protein B0T23DRAFT_442296 [Neurospora hispaniola]
MFDTHSKQRSWMKRQKVRLTRQLHRITNGLFSSPSESRPSSQIRGSPRYRSPSPFPLQRLTAKEVAEIEGQPEEPEDTTGCDDLDELSHSASHASNASSMWRPPILYLDKTRQSRSPSLSTSQAVQARREVKLITPPPTKAQSQSAIIEQVPSAVVNDKTSPLSDTVPFAVDNSSEWENVTAHDTRGTMIQDLTFCSLDETPVLNPTRPLRYLGIIGGMRLDPKQRSPLTPWNECPNEGLATRTPPQIHQSPSGYILPWLILWLI